MKDFKISGVYKITNLKNNKFYIGSSVNILKRWKSHKERYTNANSKEYNKPLYVEMRKYGLKNFKFEILYEEENEKELRALEKKIILESKAYDKGYNSNIKNENHPNRKLVLEDIKEIRKLRNKNISLHEAYQKYSNKISFSGFHKIWLYETWPEINSGEKEKYIPNYSNPGETNPRAKLSNAEVLYIRKLKALGMNRKDVYQKFSNKLSFKSFENIWYNCNWKSLT